MHLLNFPSSCLVLSICFLAFPLLPRIVLFPGLYVGEWHAVLEIACRIMSHSFLVVLHVAKYVYLHSCTCDRPPSRCLSLPHVCPAYSTYSPARCCFGFDGLPSSWCHSIACSVHNFVICVLSGNEETWTGFQTTSFSAPNATNCIVFNRFIEAQRMVKNTQWQNR